MMEAGAGLISAVDYQPSAAGPFLWHAFEAAAIDGDFAAIAGAGFETVRVGLGWDSFMPDAEGVDGRRVREFGTMLELATKHQLRVIPVLFVQSHGDCVLLPARTVLRRSPRPGVRVLSEGRVEAGGPRDPWTDPLMLELADRWLRVLAAGFAGHPAIAAWDLGDDPAATLRPRHIPDLPGWVKLMAASLRARGDRVHLTMGAGDVMWARGVRLDGIAAGVDRLDLAIRPGDLRDLGLSQASSVLFVAQLAQRLVGDAPATRIGVAVTLPTGGEAEGGLDGPGAAQVTDQLISRALEGGVAGLRPTRWRDLGEHLLDRPPMDRSPWLMHCGLVNAGGAEKPSLTAWRRVLRQQVPAGETEPWPARLDVAAYYANLPDSLSDLAAVWRREREEQPGILDRGDG